MSQVKILILSLLKSKDMYGYEINQWFKIHRVSQKMSFNMSSIYKTLTKMESEKNIVSHYETTENNPPRKVFSLTEKGRKIIRTEILKNIFDENMGVFDWWRNIPLISCEITKGEMIDAIHRRKNKLIEMCDLRGERIKKIKRHYEEKGQKEFPGTVFIPIISELVENIEKYEIKALEKLEKEVKNSKNENLFRKKMG